MKKRKQSAEGVILRWRLLDRELKDLNGVSLSELASRTGVDVKTIRRDRKALKKLGYEAIQVYIEAQECLWAYRRGQRPLFTENADYWANYWREYRKEKEEEKRRQEQRRRKADVP